MAFLGRNGRLRELQEGMKAVPKEDKPAVGREFNRRMKKRFDELGIEIPFPHRTLYFGTDKDGSAAPVHINAEPKINRTGSKRNVE